MLYKLLLNTRLGFLIVLFSMLMYSCGGGKLAVENQQLKNKVLELEHRIYELTESPNHLLEEVIQDVNLLITVGRADDLSLALDLINGFKTIYPKNEYLYKLARKEKEIDRLLKIGAASSSNKVKQNTSLNTADKTSVNQKLQVSIQIHEKKSGFVNVEMKVQNLSRDPIANLWIKATMLNKEGDSYGITQDYFFNRLSPFEYKTEALNWEYIKEDEVYGIQLSQIRYSENRKSRLLEEGACIIGQGNVKIFLLYK